MSYAKERVSKLMRELQYEIDRGLYEGVIENTFTFGFICRDRYGGEVRCEFRVRPWDRDRAQELPDRRPDKKGVLTVNVTVNQDK